jgi:NDP-sugar pyrophosphorylase family protein
MRAGIIAAGDGSRLRAAGILTPKPLVKVGGMSLLERTLRALVENGIEEVALIVNEGMAEVVEVARGLDLPLRLSTVIRTTESSMHSLYHLKPYLSQDRFVLCTVDSIILPEEFSGFIRHVTSRPEIELLLSYTDFVDDEKPLRLAVGRNERVLGLGEEAAGSPFVTAGLYGLSPRVFSTLEEAVQNKLQKLRNFLGLLVQRGLDCRGYRLSKAIDVDRPHDIKVAEDFLNHI